MISRSLNATVPVNLEQYIDNVFRFAVSLTGDRHLAEDLTQDCFLRAHLRQEQLQNPLVVRQWLFQILNNLWKDHLKKKRLDLDAAVVLESVDDGRCPEESSIQQEQCDQIIRSMQSLPRQQRTVLFLSAVEQLGNHEIANLLESSENAVKANLSIARKSMRKKILAINRKPTVVISEEFDG